MGTVTSDNFKMYRCATWAEGTTHGGDISATEIVSGTDQGIFDDVTDAQRQTGITEYRKVYFKNLNPDTVSLKCWIESQYPSGVETVSIALAQSTSDTQSAASAYTYTSPSNIGSGLDFGSLAQNGYKGIWIKRVVSITANGYSGDSFSLKIGMY